MSVTLSTPKGEMALSNAHFVELVEMVDMPNIEEGKQLNKFTIEALRTELRRLLKIVDECPDEFMFPSTQSVGEKGAIMIEGGTRHGYWKEKFVAILQLTEGVESALFY